MEINTTLRENKLRRFILNNHSQFIKILLKK
jgi:hypothetical protein